VSRLMINKPLQHHVKDGFEQNTAALIVGVG
jgi:hypothetical protein